MYRPEELRKFTVPRSASLPTTERLASTGLGGRVSTVLDSGTDKPRPVAAGCGLTTAPAATASAAACGVRILPERGGPQNLQRLLLSRPSQPPTR